MPDWIKLALEIIVILGASGSTIIVLSNRFALIGYRMQQVETSLKNFINLDNRLTILETREMMRDRKIEELSHGEGYTFPLSKGAYER